MAQAAQSAREFPVEIPPAGIVGDLSLPRNAIGLVIFAHGSGSSRFSSRNRFVANLLRNAGFATLLIDLLTAPEDEIDQQTRHLRFDIELLAERLLQATSYTDALPETADLVPGYFGASTGAAAALIAAADSDGRIKAVVSRGGRPDLAGSALPRVQSPTLLIVGGADEPVIQLNRQAFEELNCEKKLEIVPGATHLFEEPGTLEQVTELTTRWFQQYIA